MRLSTPWGAALAVSLSLSLLGPARAQSEPTIDQIYQAANAGRLADADRMIEQVLAKHPGSAKAHYVKAELAARESNASVAKEELAAAERLAPGLPFAKPEAVQSLRREVGSARPLQPPTSSRGDRIDSAPAAAPGRPVPMAAFAVLFALIAAGVYWLVSRRNRPPATATAFPVAAGGPGPVPVDGVPAGYGVSPGYGAVPPGYGYPPPAQPGMGSTIGRGIATGLAVGAGVVAAEEIGHRLFDHRGQPLAPAAGALPESERGMLDPGVNRDMGGQDFGIDDAGSWDSGGSADVGGGDWDS
ncbi:MAG: hypothetical protein ACXWC6_05870 [Ramlibacter sp.]